VAMGKVIKGGAGVVSAEVFDAHQAAQALRETAQREAEQLLAQARVEAEALRAAAREQGRQEGLAKVAEQLLRARQDAARLLQQGERQAVSLALRIAERILGRDLQRAPELLAELCATALEQQRSTSAVVLRVHPSSAAVLRAEQPRLHALLARSVDVVLKEDPAVQPEGCILQTESGTLDAQLATQLRMLERVLLGDGAPGPG